MYNDCAVSSLRWNQVEGPWEYPSDSLSFPTSATRFETFTPHVVTPLPHPSPPLQAKGLLTSYPIHVPLRSQVERGIWSDGTDIVLSADHPEVRRYLAQARNAWTLPPAPSEEIFALAALEVFYWPANPVHWMFWSDDKKSETAEIVTKVVLKPRQKIKSFVKWNGTSEYLSILGNIHHSPAWRRTFEREPWFSILVPPKIKSPARGPNLRKRKPGQMVLRVLSDSQVDGADSVNLSEPAAKRPRMTRLATQNLNKKLTNPHSNTKELDVIDTPSYLSPSLPRIDPATPLPDQPAITGELPPSPSSNVIKRTRRPLSRQIVTRQKKLKAVQVPPTTSTTSSPLITPSDCPSSMSPHSRTRSVSRASAETLVPSRPRSLSRVSSTTVVEVGNATTKKKGSVEVDQVEMELEESEKTPKMAEAASTFQMVTRASARIAATSVVAKSKRAEVKKLNAITSNTTGKEEKVKSGRRKAEKPIVMAKEKRGSKGKT